MFYYSVNGKKFFNPYLAWYENFKTKAPIVFHLKDLEYSTIDWTQEPVESFEVLMDQQARRIRNKYERLVLFWSGGTDSQTILNVFSRNRLHIDEIVCMGNKKVPWYPARHFDWLKETYWDKSTKITFHDYLDFTRRSQIIKDEKWIMEDLGDVRGFHMGSVDYQSYDYCAANHGAHKWALLSGHEKPTLKYRNGTWWTAVADRTMRQTIGISNLEPFFLDPVLHLKQSHLLANTMNKMPMKFHDGDSAEELLNPRNQGLVSKDHYFTFASACGRHPELTMGVSVGQKNKISQYNNSIKINKDKNLQSTVLPGGNTILIEKLNDKDALAVNYIKGVYYLAQDSGFMRHLNENALLGQDRFFDIKSSYSKFYNLGH